MKDSFIFYRSFFEAIKDLDDKKRLKMFDSIAKLALENEETDDLNGVCKQLFILIKPQIMANNKRFEDGKKGGRPKKEKTTGFFEKKPNENVNVNVNVNDNVNVVEEVKEETPPASPAQNLIQNWYGEYSNVHLTDEQFNKLKVNYIGSEKILNELIEELSSNIVRGKAPPYDEKNENIHLAELRAYWKQKNSTAQNPKRKPIKQMSLKRKWTN